MRWTEAQHEICVRLAGEGLSAAMIAAEMGRKRNSICGHAFRTGIKLLNPHGRRTVVGAVGNNKGKKKRPPRKDPGFIEALKAFEGTGKTLLIDRRLNECGWPYGDEPLKIMACGMRITEGSYCSLHFNMSHK